MYDFIQTALTTTIEAIALVAFVGLPVHYIITSHVREVQTWGNPQATPAQKVKPEVKAVVTLTPEAEIVSEVDSVVKAVKEAPKVTTASLPRRTRNKKAPQPKLQPMPVGAAVVDYSQMTSEQLRKACTLQGINWRVGGDYGKPMKKGQMLKALK